MIQACYPCPQPDGTTADEYALSFDSQSAHRLLIVPALFDEGHKLRRLCVGVMRRLAGCGIDSFLPDCPGTNESTADLSAFALSDWQAAMTAAAGHFGANHVLAVRGGGLIAPSPLPGWAYGPVKGASLLRTLVRARVLSSRESGRAESADNLLTEAQDHGMELAGYRIGAALIRQLQTAQPAETLAEIAPGLVPGSPLWLRSEPGDDAAQADALAAYLAMAIAA